MLNDGLIKVLLKRIKYNSQLENMGFIGFCIHKVVVSTDKRYYYGMYMYENNHTALLPKRMHLVINLTSIATQYV